MNTSPQTQLTAQSDSYAAETSQTVIFGRQDYFSILLRLIGMELYKIRRRPMSKGLGIIAVVAVILLFLVVLFVTLLVVQRGASLSPSPLLPPLALYLVNQAVLILGQVLIVILLGAMVGGEYGVGTVRLMLTRGPTRAQFLLAKAGAALICCAIGAVVMIVLGILLGLFFNLFTGLPYNFDFFTAAWFGHALLYLLITIASLFVYSMLALFLATLGRSTAAGIAGALTWLLLGENILHTILVLIGAAAGGAAGDFLRAIPDYFIGSNTGALQQNQNQYLRFFGATSLSDPSSISDLHAVLVLLAYLLIFIGLSLWLQQKRDITN
ncbi:MAG TPA: ABC transporter permease subunit [Ktedonobacteraceae bacterium]|jgi:ABC-type transport system involved in multi-copper enzyme maturation permease subunit|nr:ABC transporter permease subunit [Ktedonobacteraceae bacterium]